MAPGAGGIGLGDFHAVPVGVIFRVNGNEGGDAKAPFVFFPDFRTRTFRRHHDNGDVFADLHSLFYDIETVGVGEHGALFHQGHDGVDYIGVLLVRGQVGHQIRLRDHLFMGSHGETILLGVLVRGPFLVDRFLPEGVGNIQAAVSQVEALVEPLGAAAYDDNLFTFKYVHTGKVGLIYEITGA